MFCARCLSTRIISVNSKSSDCNLVTMPNTDKQHQGYVPDDMNIGGGNYLYISYCAQCGHMFGKWPIEPTNLEISGNVTDE